MLQLDKPEDFVISTGQMHSVREFVEKAFGHIGKEIEWEVNIVQHCPMLDDNISFGSRDLMIPRSARRRARAS